LNKSPSAGVWLFEGTEGPKSFAIVSVACDGEPGIFHEKPHTAKLQTHLGKTLAASAVGSSLVDRHPENLPRILSQGLASVRIELAQIPGWKDGGTEVANKDLLDQLFPSASTGAVVKLRDSKVEWLPGYLGLSPRLVSGKEHRIGPGLRQARQFPLNVLGRHQFEARPEAALFARNEAGGKAQIARKSFLVGISHLHDRPGAGRRKLLIKSILGTVLGSAVFPSGYLRQLATDRGQPQAQYSGQVLRMAIHQRRPHRRRG
jgi:hypothetical protein